MLCYFAKFSGMNDLHVDCPHCGASFDVQLQGESAQMMMFCCSRCKTPLVYCNGTIGELDCEEFANLRKKLSRVIDAVVRQDGPAAEAADAIRKMIDTSEAIAEERLAAGVSQDPLMDSAADLRTGSADPLTGSAEVAASASAASTANSAAAETADSASTAETALSEMSLDDLQKELDELDADSFLDKI